MQHSINTLWHADLTMPMRSFVYLTLNADRLAHYAQLHRVNPQSPAAPAINFIGIAVNLCGLSPRQAKRLLELADARRG